MAKMLPIKIQESPYVVSLDSLDLTFFSQYVEKSIEDEMPIWSIPALDGESMLCEVEIIENVDDDSSYIESSTNVLCHICNIDVPQSYFKQHTKSTIHKNYMRLIDRVLNNVSKQIAIDIESNDTKNQYENFYCDTCAKIVTVANKRKHLRSNYHLKCKENEKQIEAFLEMYTINLGESSGVDINSDVTANGKLNNVERNKSYMNGEFNMSDADTSEHSSLLSDSEYSSEEDNIKEIKDIPNKATTEPSNSNNIKPSIEQKQTKDTLKFNLDNTICIETPKGFKEKVEMMNFHGFIECVGVLFCQLCDTWLNTTQDHTVSEGHLLNIKQPINDDFIRIMINKKTMHCVLCNVIVSIDSDHVTVNDNHKKFISSVPQNKIESKTGKTFCDACNKYIDTHNFLSHIKGQNHKLNLKTKANTTDEKLTVNTTTNSVNKVQKKEQYCNICKVYVPYGGVQIHEAGKPHKDNLTRNLTEGMEHIEKNVNKIAANLLDKCIEPSTSKATVDTSTHKNTDLVKSYQEKYEYNKQMTELSPTQMNCLICDVNVPNLTRNIVEHLNGRNHKNNIIVKLRDNKMTQTTNQLYKCQYCNNNVRDFVKHINENVNHIKKRLMSEVVDKIKLREYIHENPTHHSPLAIAYRDMYKVLLKQNFIVELEKSLFHCRLCEIKMSRISEIDHMFGERHRSFLKLNTP